MLEQGGNIVNFVSHRLWYLMLEQGGNIVNYMSYGLWDLVVEQVGKIVNRIHQFFRNVIFNLAQLEEKLHCICMVMKDMDPWNKIVKFVIPEPEV